MKILHLYLVFVLSLFFTSISAQIVPDFSASPLTGCDFETVTFTNLSTEGGVLINCGGDYTYDWDFSTGPGTGAIQCSPGNIFDTPGVYTVCLTVTNNITNETQTECKPDFITIYPLPEPTFTFNPNSGCVPLEVCFENTTTLQSGNLVTCIWDFADGTVITDCSTAPICHTFQNAGTFNVSLTIIDDNGCEPQTIVQPVVISQIPTINVTADQTFNCTPPLIADFTNNSPNQGNMTYTWNFEGANTTFFQGADPPPITWSTEGLFDVTVIGVNNVTGCRDTLVLDNYINIGSSVDFNVSNYNLCLGSSVFLTDNSGGTPVGWTWDFGDGIGTSNQQNPSYIYTAPGCYEITLQVNNGQCVGAYTDPVCVNIEATPNVSFTNDNPVGCELPHTVNFNSTVSTGVGQYQWDFGGLGTSNAPNPTFTFDSLGNHIVTLTVTTPGGACTTTYVDSILIEEIDIQLTSSSVEGCVPVTATLSENSNSITPIVDWVWMIPGLDTIQAQSPTVTATDTGSYDVILQVTNAMGCVMLDTFPAYIQTGVPQDIDFVADPLQTCIDTNIVFTDLSSPFVDEWLWQFGEGPESTSTEQNPIHEYIDTGFFEVCLTGFHNGCPNTICKPDYVYLIPPRANFTDTFFCDNPYFHIFTDKSIGADSIFWDFGVIGVDTDTTSIASPTFTFPDTGVYIVTQTVFNFGTGCQDDEIFIIHVSDPQADYIITDTLGCVPFVLNLADTSRSVSFWDWTVLNGTIDDPTSPNPTITYNSPGIFPNDIQLTVSDTFGCADSLLFSSSIYANEIVADFAVSDTVGCVPFELFLTDTSTDSLFNIVSWEYNLNIGDGFVDYGGPDHSYTYTQDNSYLIRLRVTDEIGCSDTKNLIVTAQDVYPAFESDTFACANQDVVFNNMSTGATDLTYLWDFGDGSTSTDENPTHVYTAEGFYDICLTVTDSIGCDSTLCLPSHIEIANPIADFEADTTFAFCPPLVVNFTNLSQNTAPGGYTWDFGDNTGLSNTDEPAHVYTGAGVYDVSLIATSPSGCRDTLVIDDYIELLGPVGSFSFSPDSGCVPLTVTFVTESAAPVLHILDYGDGSLDSSATNVTQDTFVYTYMIAGDYTPALILVDDLGCDQVFASDSLIVVEDLQIDFMATDTLLCDGGTTDFISDINTSEPITFLEWTFEGQTPSTSTDLNPSGISYNNFGEYDVTLEVSNGECNQTVTKPNYIDVGPNPIAAFTPNPLTGCEPQNVTFTDQSTLSPPGFINEWNWDFGDGDSSPAANPSHNYPNQGTYTITLEVTTNDGCKDTTDLDIEILTVPEVATLPGGTICIGEFYQLEAQIVSDPTGVTVSWDNMGTLSCSDCLTPVANPSVTTTYTVTITHPGGCTDTDQVTVDVIPFPEPDIGLIPDIAICEGETIQLIASGGTSDPSSYQWDTSSPGLSCYACPNPFATPTVSTEYIVSVTGPGGCFAIDTTFVNVFDPTQEFAGSDRIVCEGDTVILDYGGFGNNPSWSPSTGLSCVFCPYPIASPMVNTTYTITIDDPIAGCKISDTVRVDVISLAGIDAGQDVEVCRGDPVQLQGTGFGTISWSPSAFLNADDILDPIATVTDETTFYLTATEGSCSLTDSITIGVLDSATVFVQDQTICIGDSTAFLATGDATSFSWSPQEGLSDPNSANPIVNVQETTTYTVTANLGSCPSASENATVIVNPLPDGAFIYPIYNYFPNNPVQLFIEEEDENAGLYGYDWTPGSDLSCDDCAAPIALLDTALTTVFDILVTNLETGCQSNLTTELKPLSGCSPDILAVPNGFTPNGDGNNDVFYVRSTAVVDITIFRVFNRWGELVFETNNIAQGWDGTFNGKPVNPGIYVYYVQGICPLNNSELLKKGNVTVIR